MQNNLYFSCSHKNEDGTWSGIYEEIIQAKDKDKMLSMLNDIELAIGDAALEYLPEPDIGVSCLKVQCDGEKYLIDLFEYIPPNGDPNIRLKADGINELDESEMIGEQALFEGDGYPPINVTKNFEFVKKVFIEFLETGNVSYDLMR